MSAIVDENGASETIKVLFLLYPDFNALDVVGPLEVLSQARHNPKDAATKAFECSFVGDASAMKSGQGAVLKADMDYEDATEDIEDFDVLIVPGGATAAFLDSKAADSQPLALIKKYVDVQEKNPGKERTILAVGTGSLLLADLGLLEGMAATTHPDFYTRLETICQNASTRDLSERTDVMEERYVVNNARFDLGENPDENPYIVRKRPEGAAGRRKSIARKGSNAFRESRRRESIIRRASMPLGGMRTITTGGTAAGLDASLYLVASLVSHESAEEAARVMQYTWIKGVTVDAIDV